MGNWLPSLRQTSSRLERTPNPMGRWSKLSPSRSPSRLNSTRNNLQYAGRTAIAGTGDGSLLLCLVPGTLMSLSATYLGGSGFRYGFPCLVHGIRLTTLMTPVHGHLPQLIASGVLHDAHPPSYSLPTILGASSQGCGRVINIIGWLLARSLNCSSACGLRGCTRRGFAIVRLWWSLDEAFIPILAPSTQSSTHLMVTQYLGDLLILFAATRSPPAEDLNAHL